MSFSFGQSTPAFGASSASSFGAFSAPAFGAASTPSFGSSSSAFSFATPAPAFGATTQAFGASSAPAFASTPSLFGTTSTPAFGSTGSSLFGATSTPSLFGAASTPSLFGASSTSAFGASSTSFFGAATAGTFGTNTASSFSFPSSTPSLFGAASAPSTQSFALTTQMAPATYTSAPTQDPAMKELLEIAAAYNPSSQSFRFSTLFLNVVENPAQRVKPPGVDELRWRQAMKEAGGPDNPNKLWPVMATGFKDLAARAAAQEAALAENKQRLASLRALGHQLARKQEDDLRERSEALQRQQVQLAHRLLRVWRYVDSMESRLGTVLGYRRDEEKERDLNDKLRALEAEVAPMSARSLHRQLEALSAAARLSGGAAAAAGSSEVLSEDSKQRLFTVLKDHTAAIHRLQEVLKEDQADLEVMKEELLGGDMDVLMLVPVR